ncbi:hypothetical protein F4780DRAFT_495689 [Xylariomycetidae sp. FL0641]|nr:hypothetical protein F4780DRAFT_495689 [Xylariomycetidae sp. FL0641]
MSANYVPPWRRGPQATEPGDAPPATNSPGRGSPNNRFFNNRGGRGWRGGRGGRGGGRGGHQNNFYQKNQQNNFYQNQAPQVNDSNLYHQRDIDAYFWGVDKHTSAQFMQSSTFHDSKDHQDELSYLLLFFGANPRWAHDRIVFAKSRLEMLPEYKAKKAEKGDWETIRAPLQTAADDVSASPQSTDDNTASADASHPAVLQNENDTSAPAVDSSVKKPEPEVDSSSSQAPLPDATNEATTAVEAAEKGQPGQTQQNPTASSSSRLKYTDVRNEPSTAAETAESDQASQTQQNPATSSTSRMKYTDIRNEPGYPAPDGLNARDGSTSGEGTPAAPETVGSDQTGRTQPNPTTSSSSRMKYTDIRNEPGYFASGGLNARDGSTSGEGTPTTSQPRQMGYPGIRLASAEDYYSKVEPEPAGSQANKFPAIPPIDYVPSAHNPIAVFEERKQPGTRGGGSSARFAFKGWFRVARVNILAPQSAELVRMQQQKWERRDKYGNLIGGARTRDAAAWEKALSTEWAVVKFERLPTAEQAQEQQQSTEGGTAAEGVQIAPPPPAIEKLPEPEKPIAESRSVNDMLSEMRLEGTTPETGPETTAVPDGTEGEKDAGRTDEPAAVPVGPEGEKDLGGPDEPAAEKVKEAETEVSKDSTDETRGQEAASA